MIEKKTSPYATMDPIEGVFIAEDRGDALLSNRIIATSERLKMGEIIQTKRKYYAFLCIQCLQEFQFFTEFALHIEDHYLNGDIQLMVDFVKEEVSTEVDPAIAVVKSDGDDVDDSMGQCFIAGNNDENESYKVSVDIAHRTDFGGGRIASPNKRVSFDRCGEAKDVVAAQKNKHFIEGLHFKADDNKFTCLICGNKIKTRSDMRKHIWMVHTQRYTNSKIRARDEATIKLKSTKQSDSMAEQRQLVPRINDEGDDSVTVDRLPPRKAKRTVKVYECYVCKKEFRLSWYLRAHMQCHATEPLVCLVCGKMYKSKDSLRHHMELHNVDPKEQYKCIVCSQSFPATRHLLKHCREQHRPSVGNEPLVKEKTHKCHVCGKMFRGSFELNHHMRVHTKNPKNLVCPICSFKFYERGDLKRHIELHSTEKPFKCDTCGKSMAQRYARDHNRRHNADKNFQCSYCGVLFLRMTLLNRHMVRHVGEPIFKCNLCDKAYTRSYKLLDHRRRKHPDAMNHYCDICNLGFMELRSLKKHEISHIRNDDLSSENVKRGKSKAFYWNPSLKV